MSVGMGKGNDNLYPDPYPPHTLHANPWVCHTHRPTLATGLFHLLIFQAKWMQLHLHRDIQPTKFKILSTMHVYFIEKG